MWIENQEICSTKVLKDWTPPLQINDVITTLPVSQQPKTYLMSHLLASGFRGSEYQLLVLLARLTTLLAESKDKNFEAVVEIKDFGNLDDIGILIKEDMDIVAIETYQVKYYNHPITAYDFFNESNTGIDSESSNIKNEKMHIGKFFDGWLSWKTQYPGLPKEDLHSIVYSNAQLDDILASCVNGEVFSSKFILHKEVIRIGRKASITAHVPKNFLQKPKSAEVSQYYSTKLWEELQRKGFLDDGGCFTDQYTPNVPNFKLVLKNLPSKVTIPMIEVKLKELYDNYLKNQVDLWELLYEQAWKYVTSIGKYSNNIPESDEEKKELFRQFLESFRFRVNQVALVACETAILENLVKITNQPPDQIFLCLYYAIREWFRREEGKGKVSMLTNQVMDTLIQESITRSHDVHWLQGRSRAALSNIFYGYEGRSVARPELIELQEALRESGLVLVVGEKGMGKSGIVKYVLTASQKYHVSEYLLLSAVDIIQDGELRKKLCEVVLKVNAVRIVVIDAAEVLLQLSENEILKLLDDLGRKTRTIVLTLTPEAARRNIFQHHVKTIVVHPLSEDKVLHTFPELQKYQNITSLFKLAQIPFYLANIMRLITQTSIQRFNYLVTSQNNTLEAEVIKLAIEGREEAGMSSSRRLAWQQLALKIACTPNGLNQGVSEISISSGMQILIKEGTVIEEKTKGKKFYRFKHELLFEHGLMAFLIQKWEIAVIKNTTTSFWEKLPNYFSSYGTMTILEKWLSLYWSRLQDDLINCIHVVTKQPYFKSLIAMAIATKQNHFLSALLDFGEVPLDDILTNIAGHFSSTYVLLTIWYDNPTGLEILLKYGAHLHHPQSGTLMLDTHSASYRQKEDTYNSDEESNSVSEDEAEEDEQSEEGYDLRSNCSENSENVGEYEEDTLEDIHTETIQNFIKYADKYWLGFEDELEVKDEENWNDPIYISSCHTYYIHQAVIYDRLECLNVLLGAYDNSKQHSVINLTNTFGETPLHIGVLKCSFSSVQLLIEEGASVNKQDYWEETPLHNAAYKGYVELAELLLKNGANPNELNGFGLSPYHIALVRLDLAMVETLFYYGADLSIAPFEEITEGMVVADLLDEVLHNSKNKKEVEEFVLQLIKLLNYGWDDEQFNWGTKCEKDDFQVRQAQLEQIDDLMSLVENRAQLSHISPGFDYWDKESELEYAVDHGDYELIEGLTDYILDDSALIAYVLESYAFSGLKDELLEAWLQQAVFSEYQNLKEYAEEYEDKELLRRVNEDMISFTEDEENKIDHDKSKGLVKQKLQKILSKKLNFSNEEILKTSVTPNSVQLSTSRFSIFKEMNAKKFTSSLNPKDLYKNADLEFLLNQQLINQRRIKQLNKNDSLIEKLQQENKSFELLIQEHLLEIPDLQMNKKTTDNEIHLDISGIRCEFIKKPTVGDGWCAFNAVEIDNPKECIEALIGKTTSDFLCEDLAYAILQNYISHLPIPGISPPQQQIQNVEPFAIASHIKQKIHTLYQTWNQASLDNIDKAYQALIVYLSEQVVVKSYLNHLIRDKYANIAIVKAYMKYVLNDQQEIGIIVKYGSSYYADIPVNAGKEIKYVLFDPNQRASLAHYSQLELQDNSLVLSNTISTTLEL